MGLPETDEAVADTTDGAGQDSVHGHSLRHDVQLHRDLVLRKGHVDEDVADEDQHDPEHRERQSLSVVVEVARDVHIVEPDERVEVLFFDLNVPQLLYLNE